MWGVLELNISVKTLFIGLLVELVKLGKTQFKRGDLYKALYAVLEDRRYKEIFPLHFVPISGFPYSPVLEELLRCALAWGILRPRRGEGEGVLEIALTDIDKVANEVSKRLENNSNILKRLTDMAQAVRHELENLEQNAPERFVSIPCDTVPGTTNA